MSLATEILWFVTKQQEAITLQEYFLMAQSDLEREDIAEVQNKLITDLTKRLKGKVTLCMMKKIIAKIIIKEIKND